MTVGARSPFTTLATWAARMGSSRSRVRCCGSLVEMPRHGRKSFCCGAGGAQMWKEEEHGDERVNANRIREAIATGADTLAVGCPFCMIMLTDAARAAGGQMEVLDVAEIVAASLDVSGEPIRNPGNSEAP